MGGLDGGKTVELDVPLKGQVSTSFSRESSSSDLKGNNPLCSAALTFISFDHSQVTMPHVGRIHTAEDLG